MSIGIGREIGWPRTEVDLLAARELVLFGVAAAVARAGCSCLGFSGPGAGRSYMVSGTSRIVKTWQMAAMAPVTTKMPRQPSIPAMKPPAMPPVTAPAERLAVTRAYTKESDARFVIESGGSATYHPSAALVNKE